MVLRFELMAPPVVHALLSPPQVLAFLSAVHAAIVILVGTGLRMILFRSVAFHHLPPAILMLYSCLSFRRDYVHD